MPTEGLISGFVLRVQRRNRTDRNSAWPGIGQADSSADRPPSSGSQLINIRRKAQSLRLPRPKAQEAASVSGQVLTTGRWFLSGCYRNPTLWDETRFVEPWYFARKFAGGDTTRLFQELAARVVVDGFAHLPDVEAIRDYARDTCGDDATSAEAFAGPGSEGRRIDIDDDASVYAALVALPHAPAPHDAKTVFQENIELMIRGIQERGS